MASPDSTSTAAGTPPSAVSSVSVLKKRPDFLRCARGRKEVTRGFILQIRDRRDEDAQVRVGFTCSKKVGNSVARNAAKRRLREIARACLPMFGRSGHDYVLIGRAGVTATLPFDQLVADLRKALS